MARHLAYLPAQVAGCSVGAVVANLMFSKTAISISTKHRASGAHFLAEIVATVGLVLVIFALARTDRGSAAPAAVGAYIGAAYFFTSSTSFANPAITVGTNVLQHFRRDRPHVGADLYRGTGRRCAGRVRNDQGALSECDSRAGVRTWSFLIRVPDRTLGDDGSTAPAAASCH